MEIWATLSLILKNWKYVVQFVQIIERSVVKGYNAYDLQKSLNRLERGFRDVKTVQDTASSASDINDSFRK
jgi:hypothetical protein